MKILMVCLGNICRSPLAHGLLEHKLKEHKLDWKIDSAGTGGWHAGQQPDIRSIKIAAKYGLDISCQNARKISPADLEYYDLILGMDKSNIKDIMSLAGAQQFKDKVKLITVYSIKYKDQEVPDPYYDKDAGFQIVYNMLEDAIDGIIRQYT
ncbi:MAG TPA: low molecular weight protein-tyrosine-phosphatase [Saprospiraceae bacterium]|nr:low molecular weight protein-tyrosine-phosphatase [Saprospiraceae bacterium]